MVREERRRALRRALEDLDRYAASFDRARFVGDGDAQRLVLHALFVAIQASIDEAVEICEAEGLEQDGTYRGAFLALGRAGRIDPALAGQLSDWASLRNVLAHFYPVLDLDRIHASLAEVEQLGRFEAWLALHRPVRSG